MFAPLTPEDLLFFSQAPTGSELTFTHKLSLPKLTPKKTQPDSLVKLSELVT